MIDRKTDRFSFKFNLKIHDQNERTEYRIRTRMISKKKKNLLLKMMYTFYYSLLT